LYEKSVTIDKMKTRAATKSKLKSKSASHRKFGWLAVGFLAVFLGMPNATIVRTAVAGGEVDSIFFLFLKYAIMLIFVIPLVIFCLRRPVVMAKNLKNLLIMAAATGSATTVWFVAIEHSTASYTSIISLMAPIMLVILSARLVHDQISRRSVAGISLAAAGGALVVALPTLLHGTASASFYPLATGLMILNSVLTPLSIIYQRKVNQAGVPFVASAG
jgi:drug/metabolite transporter (DMT)-like permease